VTAPFIVHPFARELARRTVAAIGTSAALAAGIMVATDETANTFAMRLARLAALTPLCAAVGILAVCAHASARGEIAALEALGAAPWEARRGAGIAGWVFGGVSLVVLASPWVDASSLFPRITPVIDWTMAADGLVARHAGLSVFADGSIEITRTRVTPVAGGPSGGAALACLAPLAFGVPAWAVTPMSKALRSGSLLATATFLVVVLHLIAADRMNAASGVLVSAPLYAALVYSRRR